MVKVEHKGYTISQAPNNHICIYKGKEFVFHAQLKKRLTKEELKSHLDEILKLIEMINGVVIC